LVVNSEVAKAMTRIVPCDAAVPPCSDVGVAEAIDQERAKLKGSFCNEPRFLASQDRRGVVEHRGARAGRADDRFAPVGELRVQTIDRSLADGLRFSNVPCVKGGLGAARLKVVEVNGTACSLQNINRGQPRTWSELVNEAC
jgi:hypothetical protein